MFLDLNVCSDGGQEQSRREAVAMALQLGYTGVAIPHSVTALMSDSDRCKLRPIKPDALLSALPGVCESTKFHRRLLGVSTKVPFRQYSRITVVVVDHVQAAALNASNPVLQTYDVVAVQPMSQELFAQACTTMEVDVITLNLSQQLPFRIKSSAWIDAAVGRGIFFEIVYAPALDDSKARKELFINAQMLVSMAHGRNIVLSSGARSVCDIRGPNDAANLSTLFGLTMEQAKAAISKNCNSVLLHGYTRKNTHRAAIAIETVEKSLFDVPEIWDPLATEEDCVLPDAELSKVDEVAVEQLAKKQKRYNTRSTGN